MAASMTSKNSEPEHMKPGISELPRPPELSATSYIDVGDWLHALEIPIPRPHGGMRFFSASIAFMLLI